MVRWGVPVKTIQNTIETHLPYVKGGIWNLAFKHQIPPLLLHNGKPGHADVDNNVDSLQNSKAKPESHRATKVRQ